MLKRFISDPVDEERLRSNILGPHLDGFCAMLVDRGYRPSTIQGKVWTLGSFGCWMKREALTVASLDEQRAEAFLALQRRRGHACRGYRHTVLQLMEQLRVAGVIPTPVTVHDDSQLAALLARYERYLRHERGLSDTTIRAYLVVVREFVVEHLDAGVVGPDVLRAGDVHDFLLGRVRRAAPKRVQFMATALRSFLRFLFLRGEIQTDLALGVPTVRRWRLSGVPRHMPTTDVERLLNGCDRSSPSGRRDYALLLLLARLGLRASEILTLELGDLRWRDGEVVVRGKGLLQDRLPLPVDVGEALAAYLRNDRPPGASRRVFLCMKAPHRGLGHPSTVSTIVARGLKRAGLAPAVRGAHLLRHSLATGLIRRGASLAEVGQVLRHRSPNTTEIYAKLDFDALRDVAMPWPMNGGAR